MDLVDKIRKIEALIAGAKSDGERRAAEFAKQRLAEKIAAQPLEYTFPAPNGWKKKLFVAVCKKYGLSTYRYKRQKYTTTMVRVGKSFMDQVLFPDFRRYADTFDQLASEIIGDLITQIHQVQDEEETVIAGELSATMGAGEL